MSLLSFAPMQPEHIRAVESSGARYLGELELVHLKRFWRTVSQWQRLRRIFRRERIEIVHSHFLGVNAWYAALSGFHPAVITVMGGDILGDEWRPGDDIRERWLTPFALRKADLITCWSSKLTNVVRHYARPDTPVEVIHGGVDTEQFQPGPKSQDLLEELRIPSDAKVILSPRLMRPLYNLDKIALAAPKVWAEVPNAYLVMVVPAQAKDGQYERYVRSILSQQGQERVRLVESIPHDRMVDYYRSADVTISIPSSDGTPMSVLESLASGTPVVVSDIPNYDAEYIEADKTVVLANPQNVDSVASALVRVLTDEEMARTITVEGRQRVQLHGSYEQQMLKMEELYKALVR